MPPYRIGWLDEAKADVRRLDRPTALSLFDGILHYARTGGGNVAPLHGDMAGSFRLRPRRLPRLVHPPRGRH